MPSLDIRDFRCPDCKHLIVSHKSSRNGKIIKCKRCKCKMKAEDFENIINGVGRVAQ